MLFVHWLYYYFLSPLSNTKVSQEVDDFLDGVCYLARRIILCPVIYCLHYYLQTLKRGSTIGLQHGLTQEWCNNFKQSDATVFASSMFCMPYNVIVRQSLENKQLMFGIRTFLSVDRPDAVYESSFMTCACAYQSMRSAI